MTRSTYTAVYTTPAETVAAITQLQNAGFDMKHLSVAGTDRGAEDSGTLGVLWTRLSKSLSGWGAFWSSRSMLVLVMGPLVQAIIAGQGGNRPVPGMSDFGAGLAAFGIPMGSITPCENALIDNKVLLFVDGAVDEIERAHRSLVGTQHTNVPLYHGAGLRIQSTG